eukprot:PITA_13604
MLQETKIEGQALLEVSRSKWNKKAGKAVSARGTSGGLETLWFEDLFHLNNFQETQHWIFTELKHKASNLTISLFNVYVPVSYTEKRECWNNLSAFLDISSPINIIIEGDLNIIMKAKEKRGRIVSRDPMLPMVEELSQSWDLLDFNPVRGIYTWSNNRIGPDHISARLDHFLVQSSIMINKKIIITKILPKLTSDHKPIQLLLEEEEDLGPIPFRFSPLWIEREGFLDTAGYQNTSFFHRQYRSRLSRNYIAEIKTADGQVCKGYNQVKAVAEAHFQNLCSADAQSNDEETVAFLSNIPNLISPEDNAILCRPITEKEIINVIWAMEADKAPGPDGFTIHFFKTCWHIIKADLQKMMRGFMTKAKIGGGTNSTYLALIPKDTNLENFSRFRTISLCNASYKILAKLLANRIKPLLKRVICSSQSGFVEGRHILDNVIQV